jgi:hypothetical protein
LNSAYETGNGFSVNFELDQPVCDTIDGFEMQFKGATDADWIGFAYDSLYQSGSDVVFGIGIGYPMNVGVKYKWRVRMITYKHNGKRSYSSWTNGDAFTPVTLAGSGCEYPGPLSLFPPSSSDVFLLFSVPNPPFPGWELPASVKLQYRVDGTTGWTNVNGIDPTSGFYGLSGLTANTTYNWRMRSTCATTGTSAWHNGPDFTTDFGSRPGKNISKQKKYLTVKASDIKHFTDEDEQGQILSNDILKVSPNPASDQITVSLDASSVKTNAVVSLSLKNMQNGVVWSSANLKAASINNMKVNVANLQTGIYYLQMTGASANVITQKLVITK